MTSSLEFRVVRPGMNIKEVRKILNKYNIFEESYTPADENGPEIVYMKPLIDDSRIQLVIDDICNIAFIEASGNEDSQAHTIIDQIPILIDSDELIAAIKASNDVDHKIYYIYGLAIIGDYSNREEIIQSISNLFKNSDDKLRGAAVFSTSYLCWKEFMPFLRDVMIGDQNDEIRKTAAVVMDIIEEQNAKSIIR